MARDVLRGLKLPVKSIPPKYFYDECGSLLFERITALPEYYLTRTEVGILRANRAALAEAVGDGGCLIEYGSGASIKVRLLLDACRPAAYVPVDISREHLMQAARTIHDDYELPVYPTCADYSAPFELPEPVQELRRVAFFPGSSIGNFDPAEADAFLRGVAEVVGSGGAFAIGVDTKKDPAVLHRAYNDSAGVTADFNRNVLSHINATVGADFDPDAFTHEAIYNESAGRIEMYLVATRAHTVTVAGTPIPFTKGERLHTENSYKYEPGEFVAKAERAGFDCPQLWQDDQGHFMVLALRAR
ncbi:MAG: L-histidine N(alpha)-methyltransferase [Gammaproteobacteria bacterium]|nr:L-histidine N(alpha)-methyltransferase [Gammaproteobacteria bacterium]